MVAQPGHAAAPAGMRHTPPPRRRRRTQGFVQVAAATASERLRLNAFGHAYLLVGAAIAAVLLYLGLAAQVTMYSYQIANLQDQQRQLVAEQDQLRYQEATLHAPGQIAQQAAQGGMQRVPPSNYVKEPAVAIDLTAPIGAPPTDSTPLWEQAVAAFVNRIGVARDAMAATH
jgi:hypothetical protein